MTLNFDDLPPLTELCTECWEDNAGYRWSGWAEGKRLCDCVDGKRPTEFGNAVLSLVRAFLVEKGSS